MPGASQPSAAGAPNGAAAAAAAGTWSNQPRDRQGGDISWRKSIHYYKILNDYTICACFRWGLEVRHVSPWQDLSTFFRTQDPQKPPGAPLSTFGTVSVVSVTEYLRMLGLLYICNNTSGSRIIQTLANTLSQLSNYHIFLVLDVFLRWTKCRQGKIADFWFLSEDGTKRWRLEA